MQNKITDQLREFPLFADLPDRDLETLAAGARLAAFGEGEVIFREGQPGDAVYIVTGGRAGIEICAPGVGCRRVVDVGPGQLLGWSPLFREHATMTATARAVEPLQVVALDADHLRSLLEQQPELGYRFMRQVAIAIARRLAATRMQLLDVYSHITLES